MIYVLCVDPERGRYLAFYIDDPDARAIADSEEAAVGKLLFTHQKCESVYLLDWTDK